MLFLRSKLLIPCNLKSYISLAYYAETTKKKFLGKKRFKLPPFVEDADTLCKFVCGLNYKIGQDPIPIKPDSEYPDWIWHLRLDVHPGHILYDPNTKEFWEDVAFEDKIRYKKLLKYKPQTKKNLDPELIKAEKIKQRLIDQVILTHEYDSGYSIDELKEKFDMQLTLRPQVSNETVYMDEIELPKIHKY